MSNAIVPTTIDGIEIDRVAILQALKLNPKDPKTQALILVCERYGLDPLLKHMVLVDGNPYVTRDGYLHLAHASGKFDGIEVVEVGETNSHWTAKVSVWRKDMTRPVTYAGRYPKDGSNKKYGPEMAIKTAEVAALRRAFNVTGIGAVDEQWDAQPTVIEAPQPALGPAPELASEGLISGLVERLNALTGADRATFKMEYGNPRELSAERFHDAAALVTALEDGHAGRVSADPGRPFEEAQADTDSSTTDEGPESEAPAQEQHPAGGKGKRSPASQLHVDTKDWVSPEDLRVLIANESHGRTTSANDLTQKELDAVWWNAKAISEGTLDLVPIRNKVAETASQQTMVEAS